MSDTYITYGTEEFHNDAPNKPSNPSPSNGVTGVPTSTTLSATVTDPQGDPMNVSFYQLVPSTPRNFTIVVLPDTQNYVLSYPAIFDNQTQWVANNAAGMEIVFVTHEGDLINDYSNFSQWDRANYSMSLLGGCPWAIAPGNHDLNDIGNTVNFNIFFGTSRFTGKPWYGGSYNNDNANSFELFDGGSDHYLILHLQYDPSDAVLAWANQTVVTWGSSRRVIVTTHEYLTGGSRTSIGENIWQKFIRPHAGHIFLVLSGHSSRESRRTDTVNGQTVYQVEADYQGDSNGGNGELRLLEFRPLEDKIYVKTYSPYLNSYETDSESQFSVDYDMSGTTYTPYPLGVATNVSSGGVATISGSFGYSSTIQWFAVASDEYGAFNQSDTWVFTTAAQTFYYLTVSTVGNGSVNLDYSGPYANGTVVQLTAVADPGWSFDHWSGDLSGSINPTSIVMDSNKSVTATFTQNVYTLTVNIVGSGVVNRNNSGPYHYGDAVQLTAVPNIGWHFGYWSGDLEGGDISKTIMMYGDKNVMATFIQDVYTLTTSVVGSGSISRNNSGPYHYGDIVEITASPATGWNFDQWSGDVSGSVNPTTILIDGDRIVNATFTPNLYTLTVIVYGFDCRVDRNNSGPYYYYGDVVLLTARGNDRDWVFDHWSGDLTGSTNPATILIDGNKTVTATFVHTYILLLQISGSGNIYTNNSGPYYSGDVVQLSAVPSAGWYFDHWSDDLSGSVNPTTILMNNDKTVTAIFTENTYTLTVNIVGSGTVNRNNSGPYHYDNSIELQAVPGAGWSFDHWSGDLTGSTNPATVVVTANLTVTATFVQSEYTITIDVTGNGHVDRNNSGPYHYGDIVELTAVPDAGWDFSEWGGAAKGSDNPTQIFVPGDMVITATFIPQNTYTLTVSVVGGGAVDRNNSGPYHYGDTVQLTAVPALDWAFNYWSGDLFGSTNPSNILMDGDHSVTAHFATTGGKPMLNMNPASKTCRTFNETFNVQITIINASSVEDFAFEIHYNATLLDVARITWNAFGTGNYTADEVNGILTGYTSGRTVSGNLTLITITFNATYHHMWKDESQVSGWKNLQTGTIFLQKANLSYPSSPDLRYERGGIDQIDVGPDFAYTFSPIQGDLDNNGKVDIFDLRTVGALYGTVNSTYDLTGDNFIDIYDLVVVARNFGFTYTP
jgi:ribosomal protein S28E/S33